MSRSRRKIPITGMTMADSEKWDKVKAHRKERRIVHAHLHHWQTDEGLPQRPEISNVWSYAKDGKQYFDPAAWPKLMRK